MARVITIGRSQPPHDTRFRPQQDRLNICKELIWRITEEHESFWDVVHKPFMKHDLIRSDVRYVIDWALRQARGNYRISLGFLNIEPQDYKRFMMFLRKYDCNLPFQRYREMLPLKDE